MKTAPTTVMYSLAALLLVASVMLPCEAAATVAYTVSLKNGNTLTANSYRVQGGKVYLEYPVGEAAVHVDQVVSITSSDGQTNLLQDRGVLVPAPAESKTEPAPEMSAQPPELEKRLPHLNRLRKGPLFDKILGKRHPRREITSAPVAADPNSLKIDEFVDKFSKADSKQQEEMDKDIDATFSSFFDEFPPGQPDQDGTGSPDSHGQGGNVGW